MTKKDYVLLANVIARLTHPLTVGETAVSIADSLAKDNPRFNREKFLQACGVE